MRAAEHLFARQGIHAVPVREINALAGQKNRSALHYHFGSRQGLVETILQSHQLEMDEAVRGRLDVLEAREDATAREIVDAVVRPLAEQLRTPSGRDFLRILPQVFDLVSGHLREGAPLSASTEPVRALRLLAEHLAHLPAAVRQERLVTYALVLSSIFAERAALLERAEGPPLDDEQFVCHVLDVTTAIIEAPSQVPVRRRR